MLRGLAALAVVVYHTAYLINGAHTDFLGVCVFFVISGFIMTLVSRETADRFLVKRLVRIVPLYWICTVACVLWGNFGLANPVYTFPLFAKWAAENPMQLATWVANNHGLGEWAAQAALLKSLLFIPYRSSVGMGHPVLGVGWTLNLEMYFYVLFTGALLVSRKLAPLIVICALLIVMVAGTLVGLDDGVLAFYGHPYVAYFCAGIACYYVWQAAEAHAVKWQKAPLRIIAVIFAMIFIAWNVQIIALTAQDRVVTQGISLAAASGVILIALILHSAGVRCTSKSILLLGEASYALYLVHTMVIETLRTIGQRWPIFDASKSVIGLGVAVIASVVLAIGVHLFVEKPITRMLRKRMEGGHSSSGRNTLHA